MTFFADAAAFEGIEFEGWRLRVEIEDEPGKPRRKEYLAEREGERRRLDWSPYSRFSRHHFETMVRLGFPSSRALRPDAAILCPIFPADLEEAENARSC